MQETSTMHRPVRMLLCVTCFALIVLIVASGCRSKTPEPMKEGGQQPYNNAVKGFSIVFPQGWSVQENTAATPAPATTGDPAAASTTPAATTPDTTPAATNPNGVTGTTGPTTPSTTTGQETPSGGTSMLVVTATNPGSTATITVEAHDLGYELSLEEFSMDMEARKVAAAVTEYKQLEKRDFPGNSAGRVYTFTGKKNGAPVHGCAYMFIKGKKGFIVNSTATEKTFGEVEKTFDSIAASFTIQ